MSQRRYFSIIRYQLQDFKRASIIMYSWVYFMFLLNLADRFFWHSNIGWFVGGLELVSMITLFVFGLNCFKENFNFFSINGISRKTQFWTTLSSFGILCGIFALIDTLNGFILPHLTNYKTMFLQLFKPAFQSFTDPLRTFLQLLVNFLLLLSVYFFCTMVGFFITTLYYRMSKGLKIAVSIAVPVIFLNGISTLDYYFLNGIISRFLTRAYAFIWGTLNGCYPFMPIFFHLLFAAFFAALAWLLMRRAVTKK